MVLAATLTACATPEERIQQAQTELDTACTGYGFTRGSDGYKQCWMQLDQRMRAGQAVTLCSRVGTGMVCQ